LNRKPQPKPIFWVGSALRDLRDFPAEAQDKVGTALQQVQYGARPASVKTLSGFGSARVSEIRISDDGSAYRAVYTAQFAGCVFVLHAFQKKSSHGIGTSKQDINMVQSRLKQAEADYAELTARQN